MSVEIRVVADPDDALVDRLVSVWEGSIRATHLFLSEEDIKGIKRYVPDVLRGGEHLAVAWDGDRVIAFAVVNEDVLEALFCDPEVRGRGVGGSLLDFSVREWGARCLNVNEQNPQAVGFYLHKGWVQTGRSELDEQGNPFPIFRLELPAAQA